jgi:Delta3-Delta2-enoyl-CoA isomerase
MSTNDTPYLRIELRSNFAIVTLAREPVNSMNLSMWQQLTKVLDSIESNPKMRGVIFQSGLQRDVFTAGNDIMELYAPNTSKERYQNFWIVSNTFLIRLYTTRLVTIAAIRGACPAGGCCLSLCCDYRLMTETGSIGLNETALGISVPKFWGILMQRAIGVGPAEKLLQFAIMATPDEAKRWGLIDEIVPPQKLQHTAEGTMQQLLKVPDVGRVETKRLLREELANQWREYIPGEASSAWALLESPLVVAQLKAVMERLSGKNKGKSRM